MQIIDALRRSNTAEEVGFLLTNYVETLQFYATAEHLPAAVVTLPVRGHDDVEQRYLALRETRRGDLAGSRGTARGACGACSDMVAEAEEVLHEALCCLRALDMAAEPPPHLERATEIAAYA